MNEIAFMQRALQLAELGRQHASPNPMVGCVIVHNGKVIGEGWHKRYGEAHAEVNAIDSVTDKSLLSAATAYVTLEPCSHFGKTPPCADLLIKYHLKRVVICNEDPFPQVAGSGIKKLRQAGIEVEVGLLEEEGRRLNKRFFTRIEKKRPYILLKWAETADGFVASEGGKPIQITGKQSQQLVHKWRNEETAIMVGTTTVLSDNPRLNVRYWTGKNPVRVIIDKSLRVPKTNFVLDQTQRTLIFNDLEDKVDKLNEYIKVPKGEEYIPYIIAYLEKLNYQSLLVEGGTKLLQQFIEKQLFDEIQVFKSKTILGTGVSSPACLKNGQLLNSQSVGEDLLFTYSL